VHFHPQWQVVQQRLDVVLKPLRVASVQALMQALGISAENLLCVRVYVYLRIYVSAYLAIPCVSANDNV